MSTSPRGPSQTRSNLSPLSQSLTYRRSSEGNYTTPAQFILRVPHPPSPIMEVCQRASRAHSLTGAGRESGFIHNRTPSPFREDRQRTLSDSNHTGSGCSSPDSSSRRSSVDSCSELVAALEALTLELQSAEAEASVQPAPVQADVSMETKAEVTEEVQSDEKMRNSRSIDLTEKERLLTECKNQIQSLSHSKQQLERRVEELERENELCAPFRAANKKSGAKCWTKLRINMKDFKQDFPTDDKHVESSEIINAILKSERHYLNGLCVLHKGYELPLRMMGAYNPEVVSVKQLDTIFLNCSDLFLLHRHLYEELSQLPSLPESIQVDKLLEVLERTFNSFSLHYNSFLDNTRPQAIQRELKPLMQKNEFKQLLSHCQENCNGAKLTDLLQLPLDRMTQYSDLLTHFLDPHVRGIPEDGSKRAETLIRFLRNLRYDLLDDKSDWDHTLEKVKFLNKLVSDMPIPLEVFDSDVVLLKQGPLNQVLGNKKEVPRFCFLFNKFIAVAEKANDTQFRLVERGMIPLSGAQLHKCVDMEGQAIGSDLQSGLSEDRLAFRLSFHNSDSLFLRAAKPNVLKAWLEALDKSLQECQASQDNSELEHFGPLYPEVGTKIAAASLEKLFQQLTSPQLSRDDFIEVFLMTHTCFTTPKEVLTALLNCVKGLDDCSADTISQTSSVAFPFSMDDLPANDSDGGASSVSSPASNHCASPSTVTHRTKLDPLAASTRKDVHSGSSLVSTSDSDTSPHTSAIVIDNPPSAGGPTQNGWLDPEMSLKFVGKPPLPNKTMEEADEDSPYTKLYPRSHVHIPCDGSGEESGEEYEGDGGVTPRQSSLTGSLEVGPAHPGQAHRQRSLTEGETKDLTDGVLQTKLEEVGHYSHLGRELEDASKMMADMIGSLDTDFLDTPQCDNLESSLDKNGAVRIQRSDSLSTSEPDMSTLPSDEPPPLPPRNLPPRKSLSITQSSSEHNLMTQSLNISRSEPSSPFHVAHKPGRSGSILSDRSPTKQKGKSMTIDRSNPPSKQSKKQKKGGTFGDYYKKGGTPTVNVTASLGPMSAHQVDLSKSPKRSKWGELRSKMKINKKFKRSPSLDAEEMQSAQSRYPRKGSLACDSLMSTGVNLTDGGMPSRQRRSSSSFNNSHILMTKIFSVLSWWQEHCFEDFEEDLELKKMLHDFLSALAKNSSDSVEGLAASKLLEVLEQKSLQEMATPMTSSFPVLLSRTISVSHDVLIMYDWDHPDKLMPDKTIDLSKIKDSQFLKVISEQLTLMEFAVYAAIQRRELLNCNWKKPNKDKLAPNVCRLIKRTNEMTSWVSTEILSQETPCQRAQVIENFIKIATCCYHHNDMHCALNITIALGSACIKSLRQTWDEVDRKYRRHLEKLREWTDYQGRCKKMRERLERMTAECQQKTNQLPVAFPYVGAYLDQIYSLEMSSKTYNPNGLVNFAKMTKLSAMLRSALQYQTQHFTFEPRLDIMVYVTAAKRLSENDLYELSRTREPSSH